jgi:hypothetical protein
MDTSNYKNNILHQNYRHFKFETNQSTNIPQGGLLQLEQRHTHTDPRKLVNARETYIRFKTDIMIASEIKTKFEE